MPNTVLDQNSLNCTINQEATGRDWGGGRGKEGGWRNGGAREEEGREGGRERGREGGRDKEGTTKDGWREDMFTFRDT